MKEKDLKLLWMFTLRIGMYIGIENKEGIAAFLYGYEAGRNNQFNFIDQISQSIEKEYLIERSGTGWIGQIEILAEKTNLDWTSTFKKQSLKVLSSQLSKSTKIKFSNSIKTRISSKLSGLNHHFRIDWISDWLGIVNLEADWFSNLWSSKELLLLHRIAEELKAYGKISELKSPIAPTDKLIYHCANMYEEMNKTANPQRASSQKIKSALRMGHCLPLLTFTI